MLYLRKLSRAFFGRSPTPLLHRELHLEGSTLAAILSRAQFNLAAGARVEIYAILPQASVLQGTRVLAYGCLVALVAAGLWEPIERERDKPTRTLRRSAMRARRVHRHVIGAASSLTGLFTERITPGPLPLMSTRRPTKSASLKRPPSPHSASRPPSDTLCIDVPEPEPLASAGERARDGDGVRRGEGEGARRAAARGEGSCDTASPQRSMSSSSSTKRCAPSCKV